MCLSALNICNGLFIQLNNTIYRFTVLQETIKQLQEEVSCIEEAHCVFRTFSDWLSAAQNNFSTVAISVDVVDRFAMERKMKKLEVQ